MQILAFPAWSYALMALAVSAIILGIRHFEKRKQETQLRRKLDPQRTREEYQEFLDHLQDGYMETDDHGKITFVNRSFLNDLGVKRPEELYGKAFWHLAPEKYQEGLAGTFKQVFETRAPLDHFKMVYPGSRGKRQVGEVAVSPVLHEGSVTATKCIIRNITRRFDAEKEQSFQQDFLEALLQQAPMAIAVLDKSGNLSVVNPSFEKFFGETGEDITGKKLDAFLAAPELMKSTNEYLKSRAGTPFYRAGRRNRRDGSVSDVEVFVQPFFAGSIKYGHLVFFNDISEQRKAEAELVNTTNTYRSVLDNLNDAYFEADIKGYLTFVNRPFVDAVRHQSRESLIGTHFRHLVERGSRKRFLREFMQIYTIGKTVKPIELRYITSEGRELISEVVASPILENGKAVGSRGIIRDISIRVKAEEILREAKEEAERDLEIGREIQLGFFPATLPEVTGWDIAARIKVARQVSGDFYDVFPMAGGSCYGLVIADVCDKGVGAALFMVLLRTLLRSTAEQYPTGTPAELMLDEIIRKVNHYVVNTHGQSNMFATLVMGILDCSRQNFHYINAGHDSPVVVDRHGKIRETLEPTGPAVGFSADLPFDRRMLTFQPGDVLLAFTDGLTEARNMEGAFYTEERLLQDASRSWPSAFSTVHQLVANVFGHMGEQMQFDDLTVLAIRRKMENELNCHVFHRKALMENLAQFRDFVEETSLLLNLEQDLAQSIKLAVDEVCANLIQYGYEDRDPGEIKLSILPGEKELEIRIEDQGQPFDPSGADTPYLGDDIAQRQIGGLGLYMVKEIMDEVRYESHPDRNTLVLKKKIK